MTADTRAITQDWTEPGVYPVAPGVHRVPLPLPTDRLKAVNVYVIVEDGGLTLIDSGWALDQARAALTSALATLGAGLGDVRSFLVTHIHRDHYTLGVQLRREFGTTLALGLGEKPGMEVLLAGGLRPFSPQLAELQASGASEVLDQLAAMDRQPPGDLGDWENPDKWLAPHSELSLTSRTLRVLPTPGHTQGHVVFTDSAAGLLFAGDHVLPHITPSIGFEAAPADSPLADYLNSLELIRKLPDLTLLPAHGWVADSTHARIAELIAHHDERLREMAGAVASLGTATAAQVAAAIGWTRRRRSFGSLDVFNQMLAVTETFAHLNLLAADGVLTAAGDPVEFRLAQAGDPAAGA